MYCWWCVVFIYNVQRGAFNIRPFDVTLSSVRSRLIRSIFAIYIFDQSLQNAENSLSNIQPLSLYSPLNVFLASHAILLNTPSPRVAAGQHWLPTEPVLATCLVKYSPGHLSSLEMRLGHSRGLRRQSECWHCLAGRDPGRGWGWWPGRGQLRQSSPSSEALISPAYCEHCDLQSPTLANTRDLTTRRGLGSNSSNLIHWPIVPSKVSAKVCAVCNQRRESVRGRVIVTIEKLCC